MANIKHFADWNGQTVELSGIHGMRNAAFVATFNIKGRWYDSFSRLVGYAPDSNTILPVTRVVEFKSNPSRHECDARCLHAKGKIMRCECSCGGKNHGKYS